MGHLDSLEAKLVPREDDVPAVAKVALSLGAAAAIGAYLRANRTRPGFHRVSAHRRDLPRFFDSGLVHQAFRDLGSDWTIVGDNRARRSRGRRFVDIEHRSGVYAVLRDTGETDSIHPNVSSAKRTAERLLRMDFLREPRGTRMAELRDYVPEVY